MRLTFASLLLSAALASGCSGSSSTNAPAIPDQTGLIGPEGGTVQVREGPIAGASVVVPPGALDREIPIAIGGASDLTEPGFSTWGPAVSFTPEGLTFLKPVTVVLPVPPTTGVPTAYQVAHASEGEPQERLEPYGVREGGTEVKLETTEFSVFQTMVPQETPAPTSSPTPRGAIPANASFPTKTTTTMWNPLIQPLSSDTFLTTGYNSDGSATANPLLDAGVLAVAGIQYDLRQLTTGSTITPPGGAALTVYSAIPVLATTDYAYRNLAKYYLNQPANSIHPDPMPTTQTAGKINQGKKTAIATEPTASSYDANTPVYLSTNGQDDPLYFFPNLPNGRDGNGNYTDRNGLTENVAWTPNAFLYTLQQNLYDTGLYWSFAHGWASPAETQSQTVQWNRLDDTNLVADNPGNTLLTLANNSTDLVAATIGLALPNLNVFGTVGSAAYYVNTDANTSNPNIANVQQAPVWLQYGAFFGYQPIPGFQCNLLRQQTPGGTFTPAENTSFLFMQATGKGEFPAAFNGTTVTGPVPLVTQTWVDQSFVIYNNTNQAVPSTQDQYPGAEYYYLGNTYLPKKAGLVNRWTHYPRMTLVSAGVDQPDERDTDCWLGLRGDTPWDVMAWMTGYTLPSTGSLTPLPNNLMSLDSGGQARKPYMLGASQQVVSTTDSTVEYTFRLENSNSFWWTQVPIHDSSRKGMYRATVYIDPDGSGSGYQAVATVSWIWRPFSFALADPTTSGTTFYKWTKAVRPNPNGGGQPVLGSWVPQFNWLVESTGTNSPPDAKGFPSGWVNILPSSSTPQVYSLGGPNGANVSLTVNEATLTNPAGGVLQAITWSPPSSGPFSAAGFPGTPVLNSSTVNNLKNPELLRFTINGVVQANSDGTIPCFLVVLDLPVAPKPHH